MAGVHVYRTTKTTKLQGKLRQKTKGAYYHYRLTIADGTRKEFTLKTRDYEEAVQKASELDSIWLTPNGIKKLGQLRKLCLLGEVLPRRYKPLILKEYLMRSFRGRFFSALWYFRGRPNFGFWGDLRGLCGRHRPHVRACTSRETGPFVAFPLFQRWIAFPCRMG